MIRHLLLAALIPSLLAGTALAQSTTPGTAGKPAPLPIEISPEIFPSVTPLPAKPPVLPTPEPSLMPSPSPSFTPGPTPKPTIRPSASPSPTAQPTSQPTSQPQGKAELSFSLPALKEGQRVSLQLQIKGNVNYPVKGWIRYQDSTYDYSKTVPESVPFELTGPGLQSFSVIFRSPGRKQIRFETSAKVAPTRNALAFVQPFAATVFPGNVNQTLQGDPDLWRVWVNLQSSLDASHPQRQYYMVTYRGEVVQKLLTSSATPGKLTPEGSFVLGAKIASPTSTLYDSVMPFWTTILIPGHSAEYGNHGLVGEAYLYHLGVPASHGCLRLSNKWVPQGGQWLNIGGAKWVYSHVPVGTPIKIFKRSVQPFAFENYSMWLAKKR